MVSAFLLLLLFIIFFREIKKKFREINFTKILLYLEFSKTEDEFKSLLDKNNFKNEGITFFQFFRETN